MQQYKKGSFESTKFDGRRERYEAGLRRMLELGFSTTDYIHHFPAFVGHMTLSRFFSLYELYKRTLGLAGHLAEVGVYKAAGSLLFAKLVQIFEPESLTQVHGFDWFQGTRTSSEDRLQIDGTYREEQQRVEELVRCQGLEHVLKIHCLDATKELSAFFEAHPHLQFKLVFLDAGIYEVVSSCIKAFWPRLTPGGILILDQFNHELAPGETRAVRELLPDAKVETLPFTWMPTAFIQKRSA